MKISVIIPSWNVEKYINNCLNSVLNQIYKDIEIICVDDCSTDNTYSILKSYKENHPEIILLRNEDNKGAPFSRNRGLHIAKGEYIQFLDTDDILLPEKIEHQVSILSVAHTNPDIIAGNYTWNIEGKTLHSVSFHENVWIDLIKGRLGNTCSNLWKKSSLDAINGWNINLESSQETDLMFRILKSNGVVIYDKSPLTIINHRTTGSISWKNRSANSIRFINMRILIADYLKENNIFSKKIENEYYRVLFHGIRMLYSFDSAKANEYYLKNIPENFPWKTVSKTSFRYKLLFLLFGFKGTEQIIRTIKRN